MSLQEGQIIGADLSPNANILGTQIADRTLQFRNFSEDVFKIAKKIQTSIPSFSYTNATGGTSLITVPHGLTITPVVMAYAQLTMLNWSTSTTITSSYVPLPIIVNTFNQTNGYLVLSTTGLGYAVSVTFGVDATNIYVQAVIVSGGTTGTINAIPISLFLLQETAN